LHFLQYLTLGFLVPPWVIDCCEFIWPLNSELASGAVSPVEPPDPGHPLPHLLVEPDAAPRAEQPKVPRAGDDGEPSSLRRRAPKHMPRTRRRLAPTAGTRPLRERRHDHGHVAGSRAPTPWAPSTAPPPRSSSHRLLLRTCSWVHLSEGK
jgi:hypothetical protein